MSYTRTPDGEGFSQPFRCLKFDQIILRAVVRTVQRPQSDTESIDELRSDSDAPVTKTQYSYSQAYLTGSLDDLEILSQFLRQFIPRPASISSHRSQNPRTGRWPQPPLQASCVVPQEAVDELINEIVKQDCEEFDKQCTELNKLAVAIMSQATELKKQQDAHNIIYEATRT